MLARSIIQILTNIVFNDSSQDWSGVAANVCLEEKKKRRKMDIKLESEDANFAFAEGTDAKSRNGVTSAGRGGPGATNGTVNRVVGVTRPRPHLGVVPKKQLPVHQGPVTLTSQLSKFLSECTHRCAH